MDNNNNTQVFSNNWHSTYSAEVSELNERLEALLASPPSTKRDTADAPVQTEQNTTDSQIQTDNDFGFAVATKAGMHIT